MKSSLDAFLSGKSRHWVLSSDLTPFGIALDRCVSGQLARAVLNGGAQDLDLLVPITRPGWMIQVLLLKPTSTANEIEKKIKKLGWAKVATHSGEFEKWEGSREKESN